MLIRTRVKVPRKEKTKKSLKRLSVTRVRGDGVPVYSSYCRGKPYMITLHGWVSVLSHGLL